jgi:LmbE family N-acetylglucosaminyl deacetylase
MLTTKEQIQVLKDRLEPATEEDLWDIITRLIEKQQPNFVIPTIEDWLMDNFPTHEEVGDIILDRKWWDKWCHNCQHRNHAMTLYTYGEYAGEYCNIYQDKTDEQEEKHPGITHGVCWSRKVEAINA